jgi:hypothetical protein
VRLAGPHQLQPKPEADDLQFGKLFTDHMFKVAYHKRLGGWQAPEIMPLENLVLHPAAKVLHYAVEVNVPLSFSKATAQYNTENFCHVRTPPHAHSQRKRFVSRDETRRHRHRSYALLSALRKSWKCHYQPLVN